MKNLPKHIQDKLTKVAALATQGIEGEKESAMDLLEKLCKKYEIAISDVLLISEEEVTEYFSFRYSKEVQRDLLFQCIYKYKNVSNISYNQKGGTKVIYIELTKFEYILISEAYIYFSALMLAEFKKTQDIFTKAFIHKHDLYGPSGKAGPKNIGEEDPEVKRKRQEEAKRILNIAESLQDSNFTPGRLLEN